MRKMVLISLQFTYVRMYVLLLLLLLLLLLYCCTTVYTESLMQKFSKIFHWCITQQN